MKKPLVVYKYEDAGELSLLNLKRGTIYFNSPSKFNDPYDCNFGFHMEDISDEEMLRYRSGESPFLRSKSIEIQKKFFETPIDEFRRILIKSAISILERTMQEIRSNMGIACFSEVNDNLLMWSHYSKSCKGICLEFDTNHPPFTKLNKVDYKTSLPSINALNILNQSNIETSNPGESSKLWLTKSDNWKYEKEWRTVHKIGGTLFNYPQESLKGIYFGPLIEPAYREIICLIVQGQNRNVRFFNGSISKDEFKMVFSEFTYTPYIDAKEKGLIE